MVTASAALADAGQPTAIGGVEMRTHRSIDREEVLDITRIERLEVVERFEERSISRVAGFCAHELVLVADSAIPTADLARADERCEQIGSAPRHVGANDGSP